MRKQMQCKPPECKPIYIATLSSYCRASNSCHPLVVQQSNQSRREWRSKLANHQASKPTQGAVQKQASSPVLCMWATST